MERFITYFHRRIPLSAPAQAFLQQHGRVVVYAPYAYFMHPDERMPYWCVVLEGLVCSYTLDTKGRRRIHWFASEMQGFAGVKHLYTPKKTGHYIQFTEVSTILRIPALRMREAKERFPEVSELLHVMKQQYSDRQDKLVHVLQQPNAYGRYARFMASFPDIAQRTTPEQQMDFINVARPTYYRVLQRWQRRG